MKTIEENSKLKEFGKFIYNESTLLDRQVVDDGMVKINNMGFSTGGGDGIREVFTIDYKTLKDFFEKNEINPYSNFKEFESHYVIIKGSMLSYEKLDKEASYEPHSFDGDLYLVKLDFKVDFNTSK